MKTTILGFVLLALCSGPAWAEEPFAPTSPPPAIAFIHDVDSTKREIQVLFVVARPVVETRTRIVQEVVDGKVVEKTVPFNVTRMVTEMQIRLWSAKNCKAIDAKGMELSMDDLARRLKKNDPVLMASTNKVDPAYLKVLNANAVVLLSP